MRQGRNKMLWDHTAHLLSIINNVNVDNEDNLKSPAEMNPYYADLVKKQKIMVSDLSFFKSMCANVKG